MHEAVLFSDGTPMTCVRPGAPVPLQINRIFAVQLRPEDGQNVGRKGGIGIRECPHEAHAAQKCGVSQTIVRPPELTKGLQSPGIQHKAPGEVLGRGRPIETAETLALGIGQGTCGLVCETPQLCETPGPGEKQRAKPTLAHHVCGRDVFCKMFRTGWIPTPKAAA